MRTKLFITGLACVLAVGVSAQVSLTGDKDFKEQGWKKSGKQEISLKDNAVIIDDQSDKDTATLTHAIAPALANAIRKYGFELSFSSRISDANPSGTGIELYVTKALRVRLNLSSYQNKQNISFYDETAKKNRVNAIKTDGFVNYRVVWKPDADGGKISLFANDKRSDFTSARTTARNWPDGIRIGGLGASKPRKGKLEIKNLKLKALTAE